MRVVALSCSNTEIVCALGCADCLVGVDDHSDFPADVVERLSKVGPDLGIDIDMYLGRPPPRLLDGYLLLRSIIADVQQDI
jgi:iron complex transport system substrate-binding protein